MLSLGVGGVDGDMIRNIVGSETGSTGQHEGSTFTGALYRAGAAGYHSWASARTGPQPGFAASLVVPTGPVNAPRRWGALACVYLGVPAS